MAFTIILIIFIFYLDVIIFLDRSRKSNSGKVTSDNSGGTGDLSPTGADIKDDKE